jgi:hypothetical protein
MDSCQKIYERTTANIITKLIQLRNSSIKREKLVIALESHLSNGTFPPNLNFSLANFQFPAATTEEEKEELNNSEAELLYQFKLDILTNRLNLSKTIYKRLSDQLLLQSQPSAIKKQILDEIPTLTNKQTILSNLIFTVETQYGVFIAKEQPWAIPTKPVEPPMGESLSSNADMESIRKELSAIRLMVEKRDSLPRRHQPLNHQDPRAHRRGSDATTDGSQDKRFQKNRQSPYRRERAPSNSNPNSRSQSPSARIQKNRSEQDLGNQEKGNRHRPENQHRQRPENQHRHQPGNQQRRQNSTPYRPKKN